MSWWYLLIPICIAIVATVLHFGWKNFPWLWLVGIIVAGLIGWGIWAFVHRERPKADNKTTVIYVPVSAEPAQHVPVPTFHPFGPDGCYETNLGYEARWSPKDKAMRVFDPGGGSHVERLGKKSPISAFGPGTWRFCKEDPDATGVVIWE